MIVVFAFHGTKNCKNISPFNEIFLKKISVKHQIVVISVRNISLTRKFMYVEHFENYKVIELSVFFLPANFLNPLLRFYNWIIAKLLYFILRKCKYLDNVNLVHQVGLFTPIGIYFSEFLKSKLLIQIIGTDIFDLHRWNYKFKGVPLVTANSKVLAKEVEKMGYACNVIYRGVDENIHGKLISIGNSSYTHIFFGGGFPYSKDLQEFRLYNYKGGLSLIDATCKSSEFQLTIAGPNCELGEKYAKDNNICGIKFLNYLSHSELLYQVRVSDIVIVPSFDEGIANLAMEAMLAGKLVISRKVGGMPELITNNKNGILFSSDDDLVNILNNINILRRENRLSELNPLRVNARNTVLHDFNNDKMVEDYSAIYGQHESN